LVYIKYGKILLKRENMRFWKGLCVKVLAVGRWLYTWSVQKISVVICNSYNSKRTTILD
jgi:hypothetical protein